MSDATPSATLPVVIQEINAPQAPFRVADK
jgi:hypothetical protein